jgi:hypothetical protein
LANLLVAPFVAGVVFIAALAALPEVATTHFKHASGGAATSQFLNLLTGTASSVTGAVRRKPRAAFLAKKVGFSR